MFRPINKQVTSKFTSVKVQKSTKTKTTVPQVPVRSSQRPWNEVKNVARTVAAPPATSAPQVSKKTPPVKEPKHNNKAVMPKEKPHIVEKPEQSKKELIAGVTPRTRVLPRIQRFKIFAFGSTICYPSIKPDFRLYISDSDGSDFKVTNPAYRPTMATIFSYDLSPLERNDYGLSQKTPINPMKLVPPTEVQLLKDGQRSTYLERRYERTPDAKYNYPEATSMRYGWFHRHSDPFQTRVARRD